MPDSIEIPSVGEILNEMSGEPSETLETDEGAAAETPNDEQEPSESEDAPAVDSDEDADGESEDEDDLPELSQVILDDGASPEAKKAAWDNHWKGIQKRESRVAAFENELAQVASDDLETSRGKVTEFVEKIAQSKGLSVEEFLGFAKPEAERPWEAPVQKGYSPDSDEDSGTYNGIPYFSNAERRALETEARFEKTIKEIESLKETNARAIRQAELTALVERVAPRTIRQTAESLQGFKVTKEMVSAAMQTFPSADPLEAVKLKYVDKIISHVTGAARAKSPKGPEIISSGARGQVVKQGLDYGVDDAIADVVAERRRR